MHNIIRSQPDFTPAPPQDATGRLTEFWSFKPQVSTASQPRQSASSSAAPGNVVAPQIRSGFSTAAGQSILINSPAAAGSGQSLRNPPPQSPYSAPRPGNMTATWQSQNHSDCPIGASGSLASATSFITHNLSQFPLTGSSIGSNTSNMDYQPSQTRFSSQQSAFATSAFDSHLLGGGGADDTDPTGQFIMHGICLFCVIGKCNRYIPCNLAF